MAKTNSKRDPMKYKTGKPRLGPLNLQQLNELLSKAAKPKDKAKIRNRIRIVTLRTGPIVEAVLPETV